MEPMKALELRIRAFISNQDKRLPLRDLVKAVASNEFKELLAIDEKIPENLPERYSDLVFEDHSLSTYIQEWPDDKPGTEIHDHGQSSGVVIVIKGIVRETVYTLDGPLLHRDLKAGELIGFDYKYIHKFEDGAQPADSLSLHFYEPALIYMNHYRLTPQGKLEKHGGWRKDS